MNDLDSMDQRVGWLRERLVSALAFTLAAGVAAVVVTELRAYFALVTLGAICWALVEGARLRLAAFDRESMLDELVTVGSCDPRCERRRADLGSALLHRHLARMLRQTSVEAHRYTPTTTMSLGDRHVMHAVEHDLRELAMVFDEDAGNLPPAAVALVHFLLLSRSSPLCMVYPDAVSQRRATETAQRIIARCRAELDDRERPVPSPSRPGHS